MGALLETGRSLAALQPTASSGFTQLETKLAATEFQPMAADVPLQHLSEIILAATEARSKTLLLLTIHYSLAPITIFNANLPTPFQADKW
ncbi:MAG: hypothetical protein AAF915_20870 [Cyanobacteria bacterium P01_D01_bin.50]